MIELMNNLNLLQKWHVIDSQTAKGKYGQSNGINFDTDSMKSYLCDYSDAFMLVTENITVLANKNTDVAFAICTSFFTWKTEINVVFADEENNTYNGMPMYNLIE